ncbi:ABC transporter permease [Nigerium massiliense]|uniref:ABC transporter permease n=1 Tax=Nigerium massiliense TaxID=1522317 RepID=UPI00059055C4|nr:ABC transporter permease [Nigerium massiliense]
MLRYILRRVASSVAVFLAITMGLFALIRMAPGDPVVLMMSAPDTGLDSAALEAKRHELGLDQPVPVQYVLWLGRALRGDLGYSYSNNEAVGSLLGRHLGPTLELMLVGIGLGLLIAIPLGIWAAWRRNRAADNVISTVSLLAACTPGFFLAMIAIFVFALRLRWVPSTGMFTPGDASIADQLRHLILPGSVLALTMAAGFTRYTRSSLIEQLGQDYVRTARAKGAGTAQIIRHAFRNSMLPLITVVMLYIPRLLGGTIIFEKIFAWPGMGLMSLNAIANRDYPVIVAFGMYVCVLVLVCNVVADILYVVADPRVRLT